MTDAPEIRASDAEREAAVDRLRTACVDGRLDLEEFTERLDLAHRAVYRSALEALTEDLGAGLRHVPPARRWFVGIFGGGDARGRWRVAERVTVVNLFGGADLDMRGAIVTADEVRITVVSLFGGSDIIVPEGADVEMTGMAIFGGNDSDVASAPILGSPRIVVRAISLFGGSDVMDRPRRPLRERLGLGRD